MQPLLPGQNSSSHGVGKKGEGKSRNGINGGSGAQQHLPKWQSQQTHQLGSTPGAVPPHFELTNQVTSSSANSASAQQQNQSHSKKRKSNS